MRAALLLVFAATLTVAADGPKDDKGPPAPAPKPPLVRSARSGPWSAPDTWEGAQAPAAGARVQVRAGHTVVYDVRSDAVIRSVHVAGTLAFARDRDTLLTVGLIKVQPGDDASEDGFNCDAHPRPPDPTAPLPALEVGTADQPVPAGRTAVIRLAFAEGLDRESCPAIVCCGGRLDLHGSPLSRTWVKLGATADAGDTRVLLAEAVVGWRVGDRVIVTTTGSPEGLNTRESLRPGSNPPGSATGSAKRKFGPQTEERVVTAVAGGRLTLDQPLNFRHQGDGDYRGEVADLSRNVVIESANPAGVRGHTMVHRYSFAAIGYAEFRHLGKEGRLGKYPIHFHLCADTARGSSVIGASVWDSHNRWVTIHGTQYLVVRDCVGYQSVGHGYFLEDGTEVFNVLDRNLGVQAYLGKPLPEQALPYDQNDGAGFWWANSLNTFTRNVAVECDRWGFRFEAAPTKGFDLRRPVPQPDGSIELVDVRTLPFVRFDGNEAHDHLSGINLGGAPGDFFAPGVGGVVPAVRDALLLQNTRIWNASWAFSPHTRYAVDNMDITDSFYGFHMPDYDAEVPQLRLVGPTYGAEVRKSRDAEWGRVTIRRTKVPLRLPEVMPGYSLEACDLAELAGDHQPPTTVITHVRREGGWLVVRGTAADDRAVRRVTVNGREARALAPGFAEWEATLEPPADGRLTARAEDAAGNLEPRPHAVTVGAGSQFRPITAGREAGPVRVVEAAPGPRGLDGAWRLESQQRAGRRTERPRGMTLEIEGDTLWIYPAGKPAGVNKRESRPPGYRFPGGFRIPCRLDRGAAGMRIDLDGPQRGRSQGLYKLDGDTLTLCMGPFLPVPMYEERESLTDLLLSGMADVLLRTSACRPTGFSPEAGTVIVLKRLSSP
jgi:uncharacterized protein (TIGR03067 family)